MTIEKVALVTAGGSGMGADAARRLSADGFHVGILSTSGKGKSLGESLGGFGITGSNRSVDAIQQLIDGAMGVFRAGLASFTKLYADKHAGDGIRMNNVLPGFIDSLPATDDRRERIPMKRYGRAEEVLSLIAWLASEDGGYMTVQNLRIDGGLTRAV